MLSSAILPLLPALAWATTYPYPYLDPTLSIPDRTTNLLSLLTLPEKVSLLSSGQPAIDRIQLPAYSLARECERGDSSGKTGTLFPSGAAMAATWNRDAVFKVAKFTALEARSNSDSGASCFGPVINFIHNPTWGRTNEMLTGEDSNLGAILGEAFVQGLQSWTAETPTGTRLAVSSTVKHLLSYSGPEGRGFTFGPYAERFSFDANFTSQIPWKEFFHPAFRATAKAGARGMMCSYSSFTTGDGYMTNSPACGSPELLNATLRGEWGWDGFVLSDAGAVVFQGEANIGGVILGHGATANDSDSAISALTAGCDVELTCCGANSVFPTLTSSVASGGIKEEVIDTSLRRIFQNRFELGMLDPPGTYPWQAWGPGNVSTPEMVEYTATVAGEAVVLLKNDGGLLPMSPLALAGKSIAVIGPVGDDRYAVQGGYGNGHPPFIVTFLEGIQAAYPLSTVLFHPACADASCPPPFNTSAVALAGGAEVALVVATLGTTSFYRPGANNESGGCGCPAGNAIEAECCDRTDTGLPGDQLPLLTALAGLGKPLLLVLNSGGILDVDFAKSAAGVGAILHAPFLGMSAGTGVGRVMSGAVNPSGKTSLTWYADAQHHLPALGDYSDASLYSTTYRYTTLPVAYPFGYGLSYVNWVYSDLSPPTPPNPTACQAFNLTLTLSNTGGVGGYEVVQAYASLPSTGTSAAHTPIKQLVAFEKVWVDAFSATLVTLTILPRAHAIVSQPSMAWVVEPGTMEVFVAGSSDPVGFPGSSGGGVKGVVVVGGPPVPLEQC